MGCINRVYSRFLPYFLVGIFVSRAAVPLLRGFWRVGVDLVERGNEGLGVLEIGGEPHPGLLQLDELLARLGRGGDARELGASSRVLTALFGIARHGLLRQILTD